MKTRKNLNFGNKATLQAVVRNCFRAGSIGTGAAFLALSGASYAADSAADNTLEAIQVTGTGIRAAIESAIVTKRDSDAVVEAISAEDIGKLPDTTIAESLARLPGVTAQRDSQGNATNINIRGLGPDFNGYLLNGREQTSTGDSRGVDLSVYPAELIGGATIYKTTDASLATAGLAGTIDNRLIDPLAIGHRVLSATTEKTKTNVGNPVVGNGDRYSLAYIDQFADRKLGLALGFVHAQGTSNTLANGSWGSNNALTDSSGNSLGNSINVPFGGGLGFESDRVTDKRDGFAGILSFKPNKNFSTEVDYFHAKINTATKKVKVNAGTNGSPITDAVVSNGVVTSGTFTLAPGDFIGYSENIFDDDTINSLGWKSTLNLADGWSATLDVNHNSAKRIEEDIEAYAHSATADTLSFTNGGSNVPSFSFGNPSLYTDPSNFQISNQAGWSGVNYPTGTGLSYAGQGVPQAGYLKGPTITDTLNAVRLDFKKKLADGGMFSDVQFGVNESHRTKDRIANEGLIIANDGTGGYSPFAIPGAYVASNVGGTGLNILTFDPTGVPAGGVLLPKYNNDILSKTWTIDEKVTTAYVKGNLDTKLANVPVTGNLGAQIVNTNQSSAGFRADVGSNVTLTNPAAGLTSDGTTYTDVLPSLNLRGDLGSGNVLRFALAEQIARPTLTDLRNSMSVAVDTNPADVLTTYNQFVGSAGNPHLKPFKAKTLDLSYEKYFGNRAYLSAAAFYKKLDTYIVQSTNSAFDFTQIANTLGLAPAPAGNIGQMTTTVNGSGGNIHGIELSASVPFNLITRYLDGFGAMASYSNTGSSVVLPNLIGLNPTQPVVASNYTMSLPGLSKVNDKVEVYFERWGFSAFWAVNHRSDYVASVANTTVGGYPAAINIGAQTWVSAQVGYEFQKGYLKGLGIRFEGNNMNKPTYHEYNADGTSHYSNQTGASYALRLAYKFE